ncbi:transcriptional regulator, AraC family [Zymomonas mobilis subsp. pomaceae ATCC 29192]|uniref:Transcriptional regulator, AraC family n=1 Tax=Zymomonas mobilis subsp. pomaceae (strain ATCC 29192 / DSM 22645 / JCM 10191 / CCUG 17912 / NBRC 13757 / NCIMB 11200 / NRRL B-4491 / Barker I) TaxID=579138 RepID=F8ESK7_ZYMMT|nr:transcriptional regulator, AraC family [Zymomonas mobilis subsp. pomaceae ATCC 29192]
MGEHPLLRVLFLKKRLIHPARLVSYPAFCVILQGEKTVTLGRESFHYKAGEYLIASMELPTIAKVTKATSKDPYIALCLTIEPAFIAELLVQYQPKISIKDQAVRGIVVSALKEEMIDALLRLTTLLDKPEDRPVLLSLIKKEITWHLIKDGQQAILLRQIGLKDSNITRIAQTVAWIRQHYTEKLNIPTLAQQINMSSASFYRHFKMVTTLSPIQFQKQIRLQQGRSLLIAPESEVATVGYQVGYDSPSQFSRDYRHFFGVSPRKDAENLRAALGLSEDAIIKNA